MGDPSEQTVAVVFRSNPKRRTDWSGSESESSQFSRAKDDSLSRFFVSTLSLALS